VEEADSESCPAANGVPYVAGVIEGNLGSEGSYNRWIPTIDPHLMRVSSNMGQK